MKGFSIAALIDIRAFILYACMQTSIITFLHVLYQTMRARENNCITWKNSYALAFALKGAKIKETMLLLRIPPMVQVDSPRHSLQQLSILES